MSIASWFFIALMIIFNAIFAAYELALASVSQGRLKLLADNRHKGARAALSMKQNMEASLAVIQLGITLVGALAAATGGAGVNDTLAPWLQEATGVSRETSKVLSLGLFVIPLSAITIIFGELIPKVFALKNNEWVCLKLSPPMKVLSWIVYPAVWVLEGAVSALIAWGERRWWPGINQQREMNEMQELRAALALARTSRLIGVQEELIMLGAARLASRPITEIMIPTRDIITLDLSHTMSESLVLAHTDMHTRFPVCERPGDPQSICGYVNFKDIVSELRLSPDQPSLRGIMRSMPELPDTLSIANTLERLIRNHSHIALVRNSAGEIVGMITLEDILEELVGDIEDEYDRVPAHIAESGAGWVLGGGVTLSRLEETIGIHFNRDELPPDTRTLSDWLTVKLNRPPRGGDIVRTDGYRILVRKVRRQKVLEATITPQERESSSGQMATGASEPSSESANEPAPPETA